MLSIPVVDEDDLGKERALDGVAVGGISQLRHESVHLLLGPTAKQNRRRAVEWPADHAGREDALDRRGVFGDGFRPRQEVRQYVRETGAAQDVVERIGAEIAKHRLELVEPRVHTQDRAAGMTRHGERTTSTAEGLDLQGCRSGHAGWIVRLGVSSVS